MSDREAVHEGDTRVGRASLHWRKQGSGPVLVLLHGFPLCGQTWDGVAAHLRDRFTCVAPDLIGLGGSSSEDDRDYASPGQARAVQATLSALGVDSYALVGNDTGGWIARELALIDAPRVSHLVLTNTEIPFHRPPWIPTYQALTPLPGYGAFLGWLLRSAAFRRSPMGFGGCFHDPTRLDGEFHERYVLPLLRSAARRAGVVRFLRQMKFSRLDQLEALHRQLAMPTLFLWGADDPTFPVERARRMARGFPNVAGFDALADAKLFFYEEQPLEVATRIARFVSQTPQAELPR